MRRIRGLLFFGVWLAILPYLGFPYFWKNVLFTISGLMLVFFACVLYKEHKTRKITIIKETFDNFSENSDFNADMNEGINEGTN